MAVVRYLVEDVDRAVAFYANLLSFDVTTRMGDAFAAVSRDGLEVWLSGPQSSAARAMPNGALPKPGGWNRIVVEVVDLDETADRLAKAGVAFRGEIVTGPGGKQLLIEDTEGNPVELFQPR